MGEILNVKQMFQEESFRGKGSQEINHHFNKNLLHQGSQQYKVSPGQLPMQGRHLRGNRRVPTNLLYPPKGHKFVVRHSSPSRLKLVRYKPPLRKISPKRVKVAYLEPQRRYDVVYPDGIDG